MAQPDHDGAVVYLVIREDDEDSQVLHAFTTRAEADRYVGMARAALRGVGFAVGVPVATVIGPDNAEAEGEEDGPGLRVRTMPLRAQATASLVRRCIRMSITTHTHEQQVREEFYEFAALGNEWGAPGVWWGQRRYGDYLLGRVTSATLVVCDWVRPEESAVTLATRVHTFARQAWAWAHTWSALDGRDDDYIRAALSAAMRERGD